MVKTRSNSKFVQSQYFIKLQKQAIETKLARKKFKEFYQKYETHHPLEKQLNNDPYQKSKNKKFFKDIYNCN